MMYLSINKILIIKLFIPLIFNNSEGPALGYKKGTALVKKTSPTTIKMSLTTILEHSRKFLLLFKKDGHNPDLIVGLTTGGALIGKALSIMTGIEFKKLMIHRAEIYEPLSDDTGKQVRNVLIIDDVADRGMTLRVAARHILEIWPGTTTHSIAFYKSKNTLRNPTFFIEELENVYFDNPLHNEQKLLGQIEQLPSDFPKAKLSEILIEELRTIKKRKQEILERSKNKFLARSPFSLATHRTITKACSSIRSVESISAYIIITNSHNLTKRNFLSNVKRIMKRNGTLVFHGPKDYTCFIDDAVDEEVIEFSLGAFSKASLEFKCTPGFLTGREVRCKACDANKPKVSKELLCYTCSLYIRSLQRGYKLMNGILDAGFRMRYHFKIGHKILQMPDDDFIGHLESFKKE